MDFAYSDIAVLGDDSLFFAGEKKRDFIETNAATNRYLLKGDMMKKNMTVQLFVAAVMMFCFTSAAHADVAKAVTGYEWDDKLGRGLLNIVSCPVELARTINIQSRVKGPSYGWTMGLVEGLGRTFLRFGAGVIDTVTCPFDFPTEGKSPLLTPDYPWQKWDVEYL